MQQKGLFVRRLFGDVPVLGLKPKRVVMKVARMLTVLTTLKSQKRNVLEFMTQAVVAARSGTTAPSLLPSTNICSDEEDFLKAA